MTPEELKERLTIFAADIVTFCCDLRHKPEARQIADQLSDAGSSTSSNYRSACRARSHREFVSKLGVAIEEADETVGWLEIIRRARLAPEPSTTPLLREAGEILAILAASRRTAERGERRNRRPPPDDRRPPPRP